MSDLVQARWKCAYPVLVAGQGEVQPGGLARIPAAEAEGSDHWEPVDASALERTPKGDLVQAAERAGVEDPEDKTKPELAKAITATPRGDA
jgi:hypothetical protein